MSIKGFDLDKTLTVREVLTAIERLPRQHRAAVERRMVRLLDHGDGFSVALLDEEAA